MVMENPTLPFIAPAMAIGMCFGVPYLEAIHRNQGLFTLRSGESPEICRYRGIMTGMEKPTLRYIDSMIRGLATKLIGTSNEAAMVERLLYSGDYHRRVTSPFPEITMGTERR